MSSVWYLVFVSFLQASDATIGVSSTGWPEGDYGLLKPDTGCPKGWDGDGWIFQDTNLSNNRSQIMHIDGHVAPSYVVRSFCIKSSYNTRKWPKGQYCTYSKNVDPALAKMGTGEIYMEDTYNYNKNAAKGSAVDYTVISWEQTLYGRVRYLLKLFFHCKTDGNSKLPIDLPTSTPFYLLPYGSSECQQVKWMTATTEWIKYHTNVYKGFFRKWGKIPHYELGHDKANSGITMYYCYYQSCNNTLDAKQGIFQSPGFPGEYPDGQLCSWKIPVPLNHTIQVHFTNFSLHEDDILELYKSYNKEVLHNDTFHDDLQPFTITTTSDVLFVFRSNEANNSYGFRAEYTIFIPTETSTTSDPKTTLKQTTTTTTTAARTVHTEANKPCAVNHSISTTYDTHNQPRGHNRDVTETVVVIATPVAFVSCLIVIIVINVIFRFRSTKCKRCDSRVNILLDQQANELAIDTQSGDVDNQMCQNPSRDTPQYESQDYDDVLADMPSNNGNEYEEYYELDIIKSESDLVYEQYSPEPEKQQVLEEPKYHVLEGPYPNGPTKPTLERPDYSVLKDQDIYEEGRMRVEPDTDMTPSELLACNPLYESVEHSAPPAVTNELYDYLKNGK